MYGNGNQFDIELMKMIVDSESGVSVLNPEKAQLIDALHKHISKNVSGKNVKTWYELNNPFVSMGSISVSGKEIVFNKPDVFVAAARLGNNFEVYPKTNGTVEMNFTFHGLTKKIGGIEND